MVCDLRYTGCRCIGQHLSRAGWANVGRIDMGFFSNTNDSIVSDFGKITARLDKLVQSESAKQERKGQDIERYMNEIKLAQSEIEESEFIINRAVRISQRINELTA